MKNFFKTLVILVLILTSSFIIRHSSVMASERFFDLQSIDTMKYSRDTARNKSVTKEIPNFVKAAATLNPTHIAISTPYDEEFYPVLKIWVSEARKHKLKVWFRGNFSSWEGWFDYPKFENPNDHNWKTSTFIQNHPDLFEDGDIFTPVPEPENGGFGDPRRGGDIKQKFFAFLPESYQTCKVSFEIIGKDVRCGYFSVNGDVAKLFTKEMVKQTGGVLVIDHYVKTAKQLKEDIMKYHETVQAPIILGEYGTPIPDIHGELSEQAQADLIYDNMKELVKIRTITKGINYWTAFGGSTSLFGKNFAPRKAVGVIAEYYKPKQLKFFVKNWRNTPLKDVSIKVTNLESNEITDINGRADVLTIKDYKIIHIQKEGYRSRYFFVDDKNSKDVIHVTLDEKRPGIFEFLKRLFI